jgi:hypothetical protein
MCYCCTPVDLVKAQANNFAEGLFQQLTTPTLSLFGVLLLMYSSYLILEALLRGAISFHVIIKVIIAACTIRWSLNYAHFAEWFLRPVVDTVFALSRDIISFACGRGGITLSENTTNGLIAAFEQVFLNILTIANDMKEVSVWIQFQAWVISFIAAFPFAISLAYLIFTVIGYHLAMAVVAGLAPLWILFFLLPATRGMCYAALRVLVANSLELILIAAIIAFAIVCVRQSILGITAENFNTEGVPFIGGQGLVILVLGFVSLFAQTLASSIAGTIAGATTTNKSLTSVLTGSALMGATAIRYLPLAKAVGGALLSGGTGVGKAGIWAGKTLGATQEGLVDSKVAGSVGRSLNYGMDQLWHKLTNFKKFH